MSEIPRFTNGTTYADQAWWHQTPEMQWPGNRADESEWSREDYVWARCWAYIEARGLTPDKCSIVWAIAYAAIDAMTTNPPVDRRRPLCDEREAGGRDE